jgi:hypothetical protein
MTYTREVLGTCDIHIGAHWRKYHLTTRIKDRWCINWKPVPPMLGTCELNTTPHEYSEYPETGIGCINWKPTAPSPCPNCGSPDGHDIGHYCPKPVAPTDPPVPEAGGDLFRYADGILTCNHCNCSNEVRFGSRHFIGCDLYSAPPAAPVAEIEKRPLWNEYSSAQEYCIDIDAYMDSVEAQLHAAQEEIIELTEERDCLRSSMDHQLTYGNFNDNPLPPANTMTDAQLDEAWEYGGEKCTCWHCHWFRYIMELRGKLAAEITTPILIPNQDDCIPPKHICLEKAAPVAEIGDFPGTAEDAQDLLNTLDDMAEEVKLRLQVAELEARLHAAQVALETIPKLEFAIHSALIDLQAGEFASPSKAVETLKAALGEK